MTGPMLPEPFADLAAFAEWSVPVERDRHRKRVTSDLAAARAFYEAMLPRMEAIITYLNARPWESLSAAERNLVALACAFMEVTHPVELGWKATDIEDAFPYERVEFLSVSARPWGEAASA
ncbi:MAG: hypothetical protein HY294_01970 [Candidatus Rokubacteria bacterium]|nr:hypothetical protein [Candidatus Rokubacteria bacterium]